MQNGICIVLRARNTVVSALLHGSCCELNAPHTQSYVCHDPCDESPRLYRIHCVRIRFLLVTRFASHLDMKPFDVETSVEDGYTPLKCKGLGLVGAAVVVEVVVLFLGAPRPTERTN